MKKTLKLAYGRRPQDNSDYPPNMRFARGPQYNSNFFLIILLIRLISSYIPKIILLTFLILEIAMKKTLKLGFGRRPYNISNCVLNISSY